MADTAHAHCCESADPRREAVHAGTRISLEFILELISSGATTADIVRAYPRLTPEDVAAAAALAANVPRTTSMTEEEITR